MQTEGTMLAPRRPRQSPLCDLQVQYRKLQPEIEAAVLRVPRVRPGDPRSSEVAALEQEVAEYCGATQATGAVREPTRYAGFGGAGRRSRRRSHHAAVYVFRHGRVGRPSRGQAGVCGHRPETYNVDPGRGRAVTPRTKAILPVHLFGQCATWIRWKKSPPTMTCRSLRTRPRRSGPITGASEPARSAPSPDVVLSDQKPRDVRRRRDGRDIRSRLGGSNGHATGSRHETEVPSPASRLECPDRCFARGDPASEAATCRIIASGSGSSPLPDDTTRSLPAAGWTGF